MAECVDSDDVDTKTVDMKGFDICKEHSKRMKFYCYDHEALACNTCAFAYHRKCNNVPEISKIGRKSQCEFLRNELETTIATTRCAAGKLNETTKKISTDVDRLPEKLKAMKENMGQLFDEFAKNVMTEGKGYRDKTNATLLKSKKECETRMKAMTTAMQVIGEIAKDGTDSEQFIIEQTMADGVKKQINDSNEVCSDFHKLNMSCTFDRHFQQFESRLASLLNPAKFELKYTVMKTAKLELIASIDLEQVGDDVGEPHYSGIDFVPDGRLVVVDNKNGKCLLYDENLSLMNVYKLPFTYPHCVVAVSDDEVAITSGNNLRLDFLHLSTSNQKQLSRAFHVKVQYYSISLMGDGNFACSTYDHKTPVRIVSEVGLGKNFDIKFPSKKYSLGTCRSTYIRGLDKIVLSDRDADTVYVYDVKTGRKVVVQDRLIKNPRDLAVGPYDHVFVCSLSTHSLVEITPAGLVLASHQVDMKYPRFVAVSKDRKRLAVSNSAAGSIKLQLYKLLS